MSAASECFHDAGRRVTAGLPFCHPDNGTDCHDYHAYELTEPNGTSLSLPDGTSIPLHTVWLLCPDHEAN